MLPSPPRPSAPTLSTAKPISGTRPVHCGDRRWPPRSLWRAGSQWRCSRSRPASGPPISSSATAIPRCGSALPPGFASAVGRRSPAAASGACSSRSTSLAWWRRSLLWSEAAPSRRWPCALTAPPVVGRSSSCSTCRPQVRRSLLASRLGPTASSIVRRCLRTPRGLLRCCARLPAGGSQPSATPGLQGRCVLPLVGTRAADAAAAAGPSGPGAPAPGRSATGRPACGLPNRGEVGRCLRHHCC
jgi:hypothetical protein